MRRKHSPARILLHFILYGVEGKEDMLGFGKSDMLLSCMLDRINDYSRKKFTITTYRRLVYIANNTNIVNRVKKLEIDK